MSTDKGEQALPRHALRNLLKGYRETQLVYLAAKLGIADLLRDSAKTSDELAELLRVNPHVLHRVMRGMVTCGIFAEASPGIFALTTLSELLLSDAADDWRGTAIRIGEVQYAIWPALLHMLRTGERPFAYTFGMPVFEYYARNPEYNESFNRQMVRSTQEAAAAILEAYDFSAAQVLVDVGGGYGILLASILKRYPEKRGILMDTVTVVEAAQTVLHAEGVGSQCTVTAGNFFSEVPSGGDLYLLKWILHDWDDHNALLILRNCRQAMGKGSRLLVIEALLPEYASEAPEIIDLDLTMLTSQTGRERTAAEYRELLAAAGFALQRIITTQSMLHILESTPG